MSDLVDPRPKDEYNTKVGCTYDTNGNPLESIDANNWTWSIAVRPKSNGVSSANGYVNGYNIVTGTNGGFITAHQLSFNTIHGLYQDRYAFREVLTDVIIQHLVTEQKVRIRCRDHVKKIAVYKDRL